MSDNYKDTWLWKRAFAEPREDATEQEQQRFEHQYDSMREKVRHLVGRIPLDMKEMTVHDISHLDALWEMGSIVARNSVELNPPEAFVFGSAVLLHDAGMSLAAYPNGMDELKEEVIWKDIYARLRMEANDLGDDDVNESDLEKQAAEEALRKLHAQQAESLATQAWCTDDFQPEYYLIEDTEVRNFYGPKIGQIAHSHWWSVAQIEDELSNVLGPLGGYTSNPIDLIKIACLLRIADAIHLDRRRAPSFLRQLVQPQGVSSQHWEFQGRMAVPVVENGALKYSASPAFTLEQAEAWWLAFDAITLIDKELRDVDQLLLKRDTGQLNVNRVQGVASPAELSRYIETDGWEPVDCTVRVTDVPKIVSILGGKKLYGDNPFIAIRELLQNAVDAVTVRRSMEDRNSDWGKIIIKSEKRDSENWLIVEDTGIGMSPGVLTGPLIDFGNSFWRSSFAADEFPGLHAAGVTVTGRYGVGFFSIFMLGSRVRVTSKRYDKETDSARTLEFQNGLGSRPVLFNSTSNIVPIDGGTRVEVCLEQDPGADGGLLRISRFESWQKLKYLVSSIAPNLNVKLEIIEDDTEPGIVEVGDWLNLDEERFLARLSVSAFSALKGVQKTSDKEARLRTLTGTDGKIYGRAMVETSTILGWWGGYQGQGCISVGGLRASDIPLIRGVLIGRETTVSRNEAVILAPPDVLTKWASEQATLINEASLPDEDKARGAEVILSFGGNIGKLPFARWKGEWLSTEEMKETLIDLGEVAVLLDDQIRYDEDSDDVHPKKFESSFEESDEIIFVPTNLRGLGINEYLDKNIINSSAQEYPSNLCKLFKKILRDIWEHHEEYDENRIVGYVEDTDILRDVTIFLRQV